MIVEILVNLTKKATAIERLKGRGEEVNDASVRAEYIKLGGKLRTEELPDPVPEAVEPESQEATQKTGATVVKPHKEKKPRKKKNAESVKESPEKVEVGS